MDMSNNKLYNECLNDIHTEHHDNNDNDSINSNCLICLEGTIIEVKDDKHLINENTIMVNSVPFLTKTCICDYRIHYKCIKKWIESNSICPICRNPISNILKNNSGLQNDTSLYQSIISIPNDETLLIPINNNIKNYYCIRIIITVVGIMVSLTIINNFFYTFIS